MGSVFRLDLSALNLCPAVGKERVISEDAGHVAERSCAAVTASGRGRLRCAGSWQSAGGRRERRVQTSINCAHTHTHTQTERLLPDSLFDWLFDWLTVWLTAGDGDEPGQSAEEACSPHSSGLQWHGDRERWKNALEFTVRLWTSSHLYSWHSPLTWNISACTSVFFHLTVILIFSSLSVYFVIILSYEVF